MSILIHRRREGCIVRNGINWEWSHTSAPCLILRLGNLCVYFRRRATRLYSGMDKGTPRCVFSVDWAGYYFVASLNYDWETKMFHIRDKYITYEQFIDFVEREGKS